VSKNPLKGELLPFPEHSRIEGSLNASNSDNTDVLSTQELRILSITYTYQGLNVAPKPTLQ
jgi:hypothetical protein